MTPEEIKKQNDLLKEGIELAKKLGLAAEEATLTNFNGDLVTAERLVQSLRSEWKEYVKDISGARESFARIVDDIKGFSSGTSRATQAFKGLESLASKLQSHQSSINRLSTKELENLQKKAKDRLIDLELAKKLSDEETRRLYSLRNRSEADLKSYREALTKSTEIGAQIRENVSAVKQFNTQLDEAVNESKEIEKSLGVTGALMKGMSKIPFLGDLPGMSGVLGEVEQEIADIAEKENRIVSKSEAMGMAFKKMGPIIKDGLTDPLVISTFLINEMKDALLSADEATGRLAKNTNLTYTEALQAREEFQRIANLSMDSAINTKGLQESYETIASSLGAQADINQKDLETFTKLREQAGFTNDELAGMYKMSLVTGKSIEDTTKEFLGGATALSTQKGLAINVKQLMKDTANVSNATKLSLVGGAKGLAEAAVQAKALGVDLSKVDQIAGSLLNFEDSISAELEAELLTGKQINLETARLAALNGDMATVAEEIKNQIGGSAEFSKMNRIQQEAFAKAVGMSREDLANSLTEQEALQKVGVKTAEAAREKYDALVKQYGVEKAQKMLGDEALANQFQQQSVQEQYAKSVEKLREIFIGLAQPILEMIKPIVDLVTTLLPAVNFLLSPLIEGFTLIGNLVTGFVNGLKEGQPIMVAIAAGLTAMLAPTIMAAIFSIFASLAKIPMGVGLPLAGIAVAGMISLANKSANDVKSVKDGVIGPDGGLIVSGEKGTFQLNKDDTIVAGTDLGKSKPGGGGGSSASNDALLRELIAAVKAIPQPILKVGEKVLAESVNNTTNTSTVKVQ